MNLNEPISALGLSGRTLSCLRGAGIDTMGELLEAHATGRLKTVRNMGRQSLDEINEALIENIPSWKPSPEPQRIMRYDIVTWGGDIVGHMVKCPLCGYTLPEEGVSKCPECGQELIWWEVEE